MIVLLMGATASGKSTLAYQLCQRLPLRMINVDSVQFYRGFDIGSAKPDKATRARYDIRLLDTCYPDDVYSVARFCADVRQEITDAIHCGLIPLLVGGSMMYFRALTQGLAKLPARDERLRAKLDAQIHANGIEQLHARLARVDPQAATHIARTDRQRIVRALEVYMLTSNRLSELQAKSQPVIRNVCALALSVYTRSQLHERIAQRFDTMLSDGFVAEVEQLQHQWRHALSHPVFRSVGYRQILSYLAGECDYQTMVSRGISATRQLAKRQITWLRSWQNVCHLTKQPTTVTQAIQHIEQQYNFVHKKNHPILKTGNYSP